MNRSVLLGVLALFFGGSGCAGTSHRDDGALMFKPRAWSAAPAPHQVEIASRPLDRGDAAFSARPESQGLTKYFPALRKGSSDTVKIATNHRPTWFGLRKTKAPSQVYTTDARAGLDRGATEPSLLPVALRVPTDPSVTATATEAVEIAPLGSNEPAGVEADKSREEEAKSSEGAKPETTKSADRIPEVPTVDPGKAVGQAAGTPLATEQGIPVGGVERNSIPTAAPCVAEKNRPPSSLEVQRPASYARRDTMPAPAHFHTHAHLPNRNPVLASPQIQTVTGVAPSPQSGTNAAALAKKWQRPCLRRLIRKTWKLGEFAGPHAVATR